MHTDGIQTVVSWLDVAFSFGCGAACAVGFMAPERWHRRAGFVGLVVVALAWVAT